MPATTPTGSDTATALAIVSSLGQLASVAITQPSHTRPTRMVAAAATSSGPCERRAAPRSTRSRCRTRRSTTTARARPGDLLRPVDRVGDAPASEATDSRLRASGTTNAPSELPAERRLRRRRRSANRAGRDQDRPSGKVSTSRASTATHSPSSRNAERPERARARPLEIRGQDCEGRSRASSHLARRQRGRSQHDERGRRQRPGQREVGDEPRARDLLVHAESADGEAGGDHDRQEQHGVAQQVAPRRGP